MLCAVETARHRATAKPQFSVTRAADFSKGETVSVFGYSETALSPEAWDDFGAGLSLPFSQETVRRLHEDLVNTTQK